MIMTYTFGGSLFFLFEKRNETYVRYDEVSIAEEKYEIAQKQLSEDRLSLSQERCGVKS